MSIRNPIQRLVKHFAGRYSLLDAISDIEECDRRDRFVDKIMLQLPPKTGVFTKREVEEDALACWFWWKLS